MTFNPICNCKHGEHLPLGEAGFDLGDGHDDQISEPGQYALLHLAVVHHSPHFYMKSYSPLHKNCFVNILVVQHFANFYMNSQ